MNNFVDHMIFVCFVMAIGCAVAAGIAYIADKLEGTWFGEMMINMFNDNSEED